MDVTRLRGWLAERLAGPRGLEDWRRLLEASWDELGERRLDQVLPRASLERIVEAQLTPERLAELVHPWVTVGLADLLLELRKDEKPVGRWIPAETKLRIERLVMRPGAIDPELIRAMFRERAIELMLADTLTTTIKDFTTLIPKLILSLVPRGPMGLLGGASAVITKIVEEVERRLEPEVHRFVSSGTKRALERAANFAVTHADDVTSVEQRRNMLRFVLGQSGRVHAKPFDAHAEREIEQIGLEIARHVAREPETREQVHRALDRFYERHGAGTVRAALEAHHLVSRPPLDAFAEATWPLLQTIHSLPAVVAWREGLLDELLREIEAEKGS